MNVEIAALSGQPLREVVYYRPSEYEDCELNGPARHDVGQGVELSFDGGHCFITWDTTLEEEIRVQPGRLIDWLLSGHFERMGGHADWQALIGRPLTAVLVEQNEVRLTFGMREVFIVTAEIDQLSGQIEGRTDNLVVFFDANQRQAFRQQYPGQSGA